MRLKRRYNQFLSICLVISIIFTSIVTSANAGLFSKIANRVKQTPGGIGSTLLVGIPLIAGAIIAAPYIASALGFASGATVAAGAGAIATVGSIGAGLASIGSAIWGGLVAAGGFVVGALGAIGAAIGSLFSGIAGFIAGIFGSPLFIPALAIIGVAVAGYFLWKHYKRQRQTISNGSNLPVVKPAVTIPSAEVVVRPETSKPSTSVSVPAYEIPVSSNVTHNVPQDQPTTQPQTQSQPNTPAVQTTSTTPVPASDALKAAHARYIQAYNKYISLVTNIGGSENPDEELRTNMLRADAQKALDEYKKAYNEYITLLRQSNSK